MALACSEVKVNLHGRELTEHGTALFPVACYRDAGDVPWHWHDEWEAALVERGTVIFSIDGQNHEVGAGEGIFINASALHGTRGKGEADCRVCSAVFQPRLVGAGLESVFWQKYVEPVVSDRCLRFMLFRRETPWEQEALSCIREAWTAGTEEPPGFELSVRAALSRLIFLVGENRGSNRSAVPAGTARRQECVKTMLRFIDENIAGALTGEMIARSASVSESECLRCFREVLGVTPMRYVRQKRIQRAAELLETTDMQVQEIGALCGFNEMSYFAKTFQEAKGVTPKEYRNRARAG